MADSAADYPGDAMAARQTLELANEFRNAAKTLLKLNRRDPLSMAPYRLASLHALELYLSAYLRVHGHDNPAIRKTGHRFGDKAKLASEHGLVLRVKTFEHLHDLTDKREYLVTRYDPMLLATTSQVNRLEATLEEVFRKVSLAIDEKEPRPIRRGLDSQTGATPPVSLPPD